MPVHKVVDLTEAGAHVERELALVKVSGGASTGSRRLRLADGSAPRWSTPDPELHLRADRRSHQDRQLHRADVASLGWSRSAAPASSGRCGGGRRGLSDRAQRIVAPARGRSLTHRPRDSGSELHRGDEGTNMKVYYDADADPEPDHGQEDRRDRLRQPGPCPRAEPARFGVKEVAHRPAPGSARQEGARRGA